MNNYNTKQEKTKEETEDNSYYNAKINSELHIRNITVTKRRKF